jgi:hypothetical protein
MQMAIIDDDLTSFGSGGVAPPQYRTMSVFQNQMGFWRNTPIELSLIHFGRFENQPADEPGLLSGSLSSWAQRMDLPGSNQILRVAQDDRERLDSPRFVDGTEEIVCRRAITDLGTADLAVPIHVVEQSVV